MPLAPLLERGGELASIDELLAAARAGRGGVAVVEGESGVGKSTLLALARTRAGAAGMRILAARGSEVERAFSFGVAWQLLDRAGVHAPPLDSGAADPWSERFHVIRTLFDEVARLAAAGEGMLLTVDDVQWVDEPSLGFLTHLALRVDHLPLALLLALNTSEADLAEPVLAALRASAAVLAPRPLSTDAVGVLVRDALGDDVPSDVLAACAAATGGNPFYLHELLQTVSGGGELHAEQVAALVPPRVLRSIMVRLGRLGPHAAQLARAVAILGDGVPLHRAGRLAGLDLRTVEVAADSLAGAGIVERGEPLRFVHPVIAAALAFDMGHFARGRAHRRAAELLEADGEDVEQVAAHLVRAPADGDPHVVEVLEAAARSAVKLGNPGAASRLLARALDEPPPPAARARIVLAAAKAEALAGSPLAASRLEEALATLEAGELRADALGELATLLRHSGQLKRSVELARLARAELPPEHPRQEQLLAIELTSATLVPELRAAVADTLAPVRAAALAGRPPSDLRLLALLIGWLGIADPPPLVRQLAERAITADPLIDDPHGMSVGWVAAALVWTDELALAERWLSSASTVSERRGAVAADGVARLNRANARYHMGRLDDAVADAEHALRAGWTSPLWSAPIVAGAQIARGNLPAARAALALGARQQSDAPEHALLVQARAQLALAAGEPAAALRAARAVGELVDERFGVAQPRLWDWRRIAALAAHRLGRRDEADALITPDLETLREIGPGRQLGAALTVAGVVRDDTELLAEATRVLAESPAKLQRLESLLELGAALRRTGRRDDAKEPLYAALELADEFGAAPAARRARDELGALGLRPRRAARTGLAALTASERRVAELAAEGMSTPQIAAQLHVSRNTVETHLGHVYRKLDVAGRAELRAVLADSAEAAGKA